MNNAKLSGNVWLACFRQAAFIRFYFKAGIDLTPQPLLDQDDDLDEAFSH